jgi:hypothetical protein
VRKVLRGLRWRFALGLIEAAFHVAKAGGRPYQLVESGKRFANEETQTSDGRRSRRCCATTA